MEWISPSLLFMMLIPIFYALRSPTVGRIRLRQADFQRLVTQKTNTQIIWTKSWGTYMYYACVGGNQIYTTSEEPLEFPESCELIPTRPPK